MTRTTRWSDTALGGHAVLPASLPLLPAGSCSNMNPAASRCRRRSVTGLPRRRRRSRTRARSSARIRSMRNCDTDCSPNWARPPVATGSRYTRPVFSPVLSTSRWMPSSPCSTTRSRQSITASASTFATMGYTMPTTRWTSAATGWNSAPCTRCWKARSRRSVPAQWSRGRPLPFSMHLFASDVYRAGPVVASCCIPIAQLPGFLEKNRIPAAADRRNPVPAAHGRRR